MKATKGLKIAVIGAGSTYTPELIEGLIIRAATLDICEIALMDIDSRRLEIVGNLAARQVRAAKLGWKVSFHGDLGCIAGSDFVMTQIRVGRLPARMLDEKIPLQDNLIGQETCGIGGFFKAYRTIPVMLRIANAIKRTAPNAVMINFTNPSGLISESLKDTGVRVIGLCNGPVSMRASVLQSLSLDNNTYVEFCGLNHFTWVSKIQALDKDYLGEAIAAGINSKAMKNIPASGFGQELLAMGGGIPSSYLEYYYFGQQKLSKLKDEPKSRAEVCMEIDERLLEQYADPKLCAKPPELAERGGANYSMAAAGVLDSIVNDKGDVCVVNVRGGGAVPFLEDDDIVEISSRVYRDKTVTIPLSGMRNEHREVYIRQMKTYERAAVKAITLGNDNDRIAALMLNPLCRDYNAVKSSYYRLKEAHKDYLPMDGALL